MQGNCRQAIGLCREGALCVGGEGPSHAQVGAELDALGALERDLGAHEHERVQIERHDGPLVRQAVQREEHSTGRLLHTPR